VAIFEVDHLQGLPPAKIFGAASRQMLLETSCNIRRDPRIEGVVRAMEDVDGPSQSHRTSSGIPPNHTLLSNPLAHERPTPKPQMAMVLASPWSSSARRMGRVDEMVLPYS
jgi:hypothetical protein